MKRKSNCIDGVWAVVDSNCEPERLRGVYFTHAEAVSANAGCCSMRRIVYAEVAWRALPKSKKKARK